MQKGGWGVTPGLMTTDCAVCFCIFIFILSTYAPRHGEVSRRIGAFGVSLRIRRWSESSACAFYLSLMYRVRNEPDASPARCLFFFHCYTVTCHSSSLCNCLIFYQSKHFVINTNLIIWLLYDFFLGFNKVKLHVSVYMSRRLHHINTPHVVMEIRVYVLIML